jgi:hypothetical protein
LFNIGLNRFPSPIEPLQTSCHPNCLSARAVVMGAIAPAQSGILEGLAILEARIFMFLKKYPWTWIDLRIETWFF